MDPILFIIAALLLAPTTIALLALRFGPDSRPAYHSSEHTLVLHGMRRDDDSPHTPVASQTPWIRLVHAGGSSAYPILAMIDGVRGPEARPFASDPNAARLEERARQLAGGYWSDSVWLTGLVPATAFRSVCAALERERLAESRSMALPLAG